MPMILVTEDELYHHGIKGQKWGERNGPPYPLDQKTHNKVTHKQKHYTIRRADSNNPKDVHKVRKFIADTTGIGKKRELLAESRENEARIRKRSMEKDAKTNLPLKNRKWSIDEDIDAVNPGYTNFNENTKSNCAYCSLAFEMRQRGFDVTARKDAHGLYVDDIRRCFQGNRDFQYYGYGYKSADSDFEGSKIVADLRAFTMFDQSRCTKLFMDCMKKQPDNSRGLMNVEYGDLGAHSVTYVKQNGQVYICDSQIGKKYSGKKLEDAFEGITAFGFMRTDDLKIDAINMKRVVE